MRLLAVIAILTVTLTATISCENSPPVEPETGATLDLANLKGQWVLINYWAPWCKPCIEEIPELNALHEKHESITVFGVNYDGTTGTELAEQANKLGVAFPTLEQDPAAIIGTPRPVVLPTTLILDPSGALTATLHGPQTEETLLAVTLHTESQK